MNLVYVASQSSTPAQTLGLRLRSKIAFSLALFSLAAGLSSCGSSGAEDAIADLSRKAGTGVTGPVLTGTWTSGCLAGWSSYAAKRQLVMKIDGQNIEHSTRSFSDSNCQSVSQTETVKGKLIYRKSLGNSTYLTELRIPIDANVSTWRLFNLSQVGGVTKVSEFYMDESDASSTKTDIVMTKSEASSTPPSTPGAPSRGSAVLESGTFSPSAGRTDVCRHSVSTMKTNNSLSTVYIDFSYPCSTWTLTLSCTTAGVCTGASGGNQFRLSVVDANSYDFEAVSAGWSAVFKRR